MRTAYQYHQKLQHFITRAKTEAKPIWTGYLSFPMLKEIVKATRIKNLYMPASDYQSFYAKFAPQFRKDGTIWVGYPLTIHISHAKCNHKPGRPRLSGTIIEEILRLRDQDPSLTQEQLALILKISQSSIHNMLKKLEVSI